MVMRKCARALLEELPEHQTLDLHEIYNTMVCALQTLFDCADEWDLKKSNTISNATEDIMQCIRELLFTLNLLLLTSTARRYEAGSF